MATGLRRVKFNIPRGPTNPNTKNRSRRDILSDFVHPVSSSSPAFLASIIPFEIEERG